MKGLGALLKHRLSIFLYFSDCTALPIIQRNQWQTGSESVPCHNFKALTIFNNMVWCLRESTSSATTESICHRVTPGQSSTEWKSHRFRKQSSKNALMASWEAWSECQQSSKNAVMQWWEALSDCKQSSMNALMALLEVMTVSDCKHMGLLFALIASREAQSDCKYMLRLSALFFAICSQTPAVAECCICAYWPDTPQPPQETAVVHITCFGQ